MRAPQAVIHVEPGSELADVLESAADTEVLLEKDGIHYRLDRVDEPARGQSPRVRREPRTPDQILDIIGIGASPEGGAIAHRKDAYLANAADHRGE